MYSNYYVTPKKFIEYVEGALQETYYPDKYWNEKHHPEDIASNLEAVIAAVRGYLGRAIMDDSITAKEVQKPVYGNAHGNYGAYVEGKPE